MADDNTPNFSAQIRALTRGQSAAKVERYPIDNPPDDGFNETLARMRRTVNVSVSRARESTGGNFRVESGVLLTADNEAMIATVAVTKLG